MVIRMSKKKKKKRRRKNNKYIKEFDITTEQLKTYSNDSNKG